ncbi:MAG: hypothetical protein FWF82_07935, partial [Oscillospiraceae bacterium]|nr:hypothetical protein [Oscillospiraceae bacterium]
RSLLSIIYFELINIAKDRRAGIEKYGDDKGIVKKTNSREAEQYFFRCAGKGNRRTGIQIPGRDNQDIP